MDWPSIFLIFAAVSLIATLLFWGFAFGQKKAGTQAGGPSYSMFAWLALVCCVLFVLLAFATLEINVIR